MQYNSFKNFDKMQRIDIGLNSVTSFVLSFFGTRYTCAIFQVEEKTLLLMHVLMTSSTTGFKYHIRMPSWTIEQSLFIPRRIFRMSL